MKPLAIRLSILVLALGLAGCASADAGNAPSGPTGSADPSVPHVVAKNIAFQTTSVTVAAGAPVKLAFDNEDSAPHNISVIAGDGRVVFKGDIFGGTAERIYQLPALQAGTYTFICDVHPGMKGTLVAQ